MVSHLYIYISFLRGEPAQFQQNVLPSNLYITILFILTYQIYKETSSNNGDLRFTSPNSVVSFHMGTKPKSDTHTHTYTHTNIHTHTHKHTYLNEGK
jgi:hypothetical protein